MSTWHDKNIQSNALYKSVLITQHNHLASLAKWLNIRLWIKWLWVRVPLQSLKVVRIVIKVGKLHFIGFSVFCFWRLTKRNQELMIGLSKMMLYYFGVVVVSGSKPIYIYRYLFFHSARYSFLLLLWQLEYSHKKILWSLNNHHDYKKGQQINWRCSTLKNRLNLDFYNGWDSLGEVFKISFDNYMER